MICDFCMVDVPPVVVDGVASYPNGYNEKLNATVVVMSERLPHSACLCQKHADAVFLRDPTARITGDVVHRDGTAHITTRESEKEPCIKIANWREALDIAAVKVPKA